MGTNWTESDSNKIRTHNQLVHKRTLNHLPRLMFVYELSGCEFEPCYLWPLILNLKGVDVLLYFCPAFLDALGFCSKYRRSWLHHFVWGQSRFEEGWVIWFFGKWWKSRWFVLEVSFGHSWFEVSLKWFNHNSKIIVNAYTHLFLQILVLLDTILSWNFVMFAFLGSQRLFF